MMKTLLMLFLLLSFFGGQRVLGQEANDSVPPSPEMGVPESLEGAPPPSPQSETAELSQENPVELPPELLGSDSGVSTGGGEGGSTALKALPDYIYDPTGRRDPFMIHKSFRRRDFIATPGGKATGPKAEILDPLLRLDIGRIEIVGILWEVANPRALLAETGDPDHKVYIVNKHTKVGRNNGYVAAIREGEIVIIETFEEEGIVTQQPKVIKLLTGK